MVPGNGFQNCLQGRVREAYPPSNYGTKSAVTKDLRRRNPEKGEVQAAWVTLVMSDTITPFLRRDSWVSEPFRSVPAKLQPRNLVTRHANHNNATSYT